MQRPGGLLAGAGKELAFATLLASLQIMTEKKLIRRQDALMNLLQACIDVLFFHHPAAWWISGQVRAEREHCADDLAVRVLEAGHAGSRLSYAKALLALEERRQAHALALAANGGSLLDRIRRLAGVEEQPASPFRPLAAAVMASLLLAVLITAAAPIREARADELPKDTNTIESLTVEQAKKLAEEFPGVEIEVEVKGYGIAQASDSLPLNGLKNLVPDVAQALAGYSKGPLFLNGLTTLDAHTAKAIVQFNGQGLFLDGLTTLSAEAATALTQHKGELYLAGLTTLSDEAAKAFAQFKGKSLRLSDRATEPFFQNNRLTPETALLWAALSDGRLTDVTAFDAPDSVAVAKALATRKGPLSLPNLKKISPKTLSALVEKEDIDIPLIESLELIPEPDGSVTEDFVIPERFQ
jgi:hypothetical protein